MYQHGVRNSPSGNPSNRMDLGRGFLSFFSVLEGNRFTFVTKAWRWGREGHSPTEKVTLSIGYRWVSFSCLFVGFVAHTCMEHESNGTLSNGKGGVSH